MVRIASPLAIILIGLVIFSCIFQSQASTKEHISHRRSKLGQHQKPNSSHSQHPVSRVRRANARDDDDFEIDLIRIKSPYHKYNVHKREEERESQNVDAREHKQESQGKSFREKMYSFFDYFFGNENSPETNKQAASPIEKVEPKRGLPPTEGRQIDGPEDYRQPSSCPNCSGRKQLKSRGLTEEEVKAIRARMALDLLRQKLRIDPNGGKADYGESGDAQQQFQLPKLLPRVAAAEVVQDEEETEEEDFYARDLQEIVTGQDMGRDCVKHMRSTGCYNFRLNEKVTSEVESAQLWVYKTWDRHDVRGQTISVHGPSRNFTGIHQRREIARMDTFTSNDWVNFDLTQEVQGWSSQPNKAGTLIISCETCHTRSHRALFGAKHGYKPVLLINLSQARPSRRKRTVSTCDPRYSCCRRPLRVNLVQLGYYAAASPDTLEVGYCYGTCADRTSATYTHTTIIQSHIWSGHASSSMRPQLQPCCVPVQLLDSTVSIFVNNTDLTKIVPKIRVRRCGCA